MNVTTVLPPQLDGAPMLSLVSVPLQPPLAFAAFSHAENCALIAACVWQEATVVLIGQLSTTVGAAGTVKVEVQVSGLPHSSITVKMIVRLPPHDDGAPKLPLLLVKFGLQPPVKLAEASHVAYSAFTWSCVKQVSVWVGCGQLRVMGDSCAHVKVRVQVLVKPQAAAVKVNVRDLAHPAKTVFVSQVTITGPHSLEAVTAPPNAGNCISVQLVGTCVGLQPRFMVALLQLEKTGAVASVQV